jgi:hypothetical protein
MDANPAVVREGSALGRMLNVLPAPGEVFQEIKERPVSQPNWLIPAFIWLLMGGVALHFIFAMPSFRYEIKKQQEKQMQLQVKKGKMTQEQVDQIMANMPPWIMAVAEGFAHVTTAIYAFGIPFFWGLIIWMLCSMFYKADIEYMKAVEAAGLVSVIYILATVVGSLVSIAMGKMISISPAFFLSDFDMTNRNHMILAALNPFYLWYVVVVAVSVSVLANVPVRKPLVWCLLVWVGFRALALSNPYTMNFVL